MEKIKNYWKKGIKQKVILVVAVLLIIGVIGSLTGSGDDNTDAKKTDDVVTEENDKKDEKEEEPVAEAPESNLTTGQKNALDKAKSYLKFSAFSYNGLIDQLKYEGFTDEECTFAVDSCGADWNEQALKKAKSYLDYTAFSYTGLIDQLKYEKFTDEQATYGANTYQKEKKETKHMKDYMIPQKR